MFPADFMVLIFQLTTHALLDEKHSSNHLDEDDFSGVFAWGCYCSNNHINSTQNNKPWKHSFSIHNMNFTWDKTLQVKPSVCFGQCSCEHFCTLHNAGPDFPNQLVLLMSYSFWEPNLGYCHTNHFSKGRTLSEKQVPLCEHELAPQIKASKTAGHTWLFLTINPSS